MEDATDLAEWRARPPIVVHGIPVPVPLVPSFFEWCPPELDDDAILNSIASALGI